MGDRFVFTGPSGLAVVETVGEPAMVHVFARGTINQDVIKAAARCAEACASAGEGARGVLADFSAADPPLGAMQVAQMLEWARTAGRRAAIVVGAPQATGTFREELRLAMGATRHRTFDDVRLAVHWLQSAAGV